MPRQRSSTAVALLVKEKRREAFPKGKLAMAEAMIEMIQIYWIDSNDGGIPPDCIQKAANALADF